jgi:hypothetical protein
MAIATATTRVDDHDSLVGHAMRVSRLLAWAVFYSVVCSAQTLANISKQLFKDQQILVLSQAPHSGLSHLVAAYLSLYFVPM